MIHSWAILLYLAAALVVTKIPYIQTYLSGCYTLLHEVSRVLLSGWGTRKKIRLFKNAPTLETADSQTFKQTLISYLSYTVTSLEAFGLFFLVSTNNYNLILYMLIGLITVSIVFWIRHVLELLWALSIIALLALPIYFGHDQAIMITAIFLTSYVLVQSVLAALYKCKESFALQKRKGMVAKVKWIPSMVIGIIVLGQSLFTCYFIVSNFVFHIGLPQVNFEFVQVPWI